MKGKREFVEYAGGGVEEGRWSFFDGGEASVESCREVDVRLKSFISMRRETSA